jgi:hypothetical protein
MPNHDWYAELGSWEVVWQDQGDEWLHWFAESVRSEALATTGHKYDSTTEPFLQVGLSKEGSPLGTVTLIGVTSAGIVVFAAGAGDVDERLLAQLEAAADVATGRLGDSGGDHSWTAIIGHSPDRIVGLERRLDVVATVGAMRLESTDVTLSEPGIAEQSSLSSWSMHRSVPIRVTGTSRGYSWGVASVQAGRDLRTLCGLLSLAWNCAAFTVREAPAPLEWGPRLVPPHPPWYAEPSQPLPAGANALPGEAAVVPEWLGGAWPRLETNRWMLDALDAFLEGMYSEQAHPSLAVVSYTASMETVADRIFELPHCPRCRGRKGIARSFRAALRLVLEEGEALELDAVYTDRSKTVHAGRLHGGETTPGVFRAGIWSSDKTHDFRWRTLWRLRGAARLLLLRALQGNLPAKAQLPEPGGSS